MAVEPMDALLGRLAVHAGWLTLEQLNQATAAQGRLQNYVPLGEILIEMRMLQQQQVNILVERQRQMIAARGGQVPGQQPAQGGQPAQPQAAARPPQQPPQQQQQQPQHQQRPAPAAAPQPIQQSGSASAPQQTAAPQRPAPAPAPVEPPLATGAPVAEMADTAHTPTISLLPRVSVAAAPTGWLDQVLTEGVNRGASDVHIHADARLRFRLLGQLHEVSAEVVPAADTRHHLLSALTDDERKIFEELGQIDLAYTVPGVARFRGNIYLQQRGVDGAFRIIPPRPPTFAELGLPQQIARVTTYHQGIVLFTGPAGCGKSATMAAVLNLINEERPDHILMVEDPIEIIHPSKRAIVNQRHAGKHTLSFARALKGALREDPDIIVIGEMRDYETISMALKAAETGHLVMATLHTNSAIRTINRLIGVFPPNQQSQIRTMLSESLRAVISQRLCVRTDGRGRVPALEVLYVNPAIGNLIRENRTVQLRSVLQTQVAQGMCLLDMSLAEMVRAGTITREEAARHAEDPKKLPAGAGAPIPA